MGVVYKLKPEIGQFILEEKRKDPKISCRSLALLIGEKFGIQISKSRVNDFLKENGLSLPVGRRAKSLSQKGPSFEKNKLSAGLVLIKVVDQIIGGTEAFSKVIQNKTAQPYTELATRLEALMYLYFWRKNNFFSSPNLGGNFSEEELLNSIQKWDEIPGLKEELVCVLEKNLRPTYFFKLQSSAGLCFLLDTHLYTLRKNSIFCFKFGIPNYYAQRQGKKIFLQQEQPLILFMAPGYKDCPDYFFDFLNVLEASSDYLASLVLCDQDDKELEKLSLEKKKYSFCFGLWPWQWSQKKYKIIFKSDFKKTNFIPLNYQYHLAEVEVELNHSFEEKTYFFKGWAIKEKEEDELTFYLLTNYGNQVFRVDILLEAYFGHFFEARKILQDYVQKLELFSSRLDKKQENFILLNDQKVVNLEAFFQLYLEIIQQFIKYYLLPEKSKEAKDYNLEILEQIFKLKATYQETNSSYILAFPLPEDYSYLPQLKYLCFCLNQYQIFFNNRRVWFVC